MFTTIRRSWRSHSTFCGVVLTSVLVAASAGYAQIPQPNLSMPWPIDDAAFTVGDLTAAGADYAGYVGCPVSTSIGEYYFTKPLMNLGGPLTLRFSLHYASRLLKWPGSFNDPFGGDDFTHNYHIALSAYYGGVQVLYGQGDALSFVKQGNAWQIVREEIVYQLKETAQHYYLMDPIRERVCTFKKAAVTSGTAQVAVGVLVRIEDRNGNALTFTNAQDAYYLHPTRVEDGLGRFLEFTYQDPTAAWRYPHLSKVTDQSGRTLQFEYEVTAKPAAIHLKSVTDAAGRKTTFSYTGPLTDSVLAAQTLPMGNVPYTQTYERIPIPGFPDPLRPWRVTAQTDAYQKKTQLIFNDVNGVTTVRDAAGQASSHKHANFRLLTGWTDPAGKTVTQAYDASGRPTAILDRLGDVTRIAYHPQTGKIAQYADAEGNTTALTYEAQQQTFTNSAANEAVTFTFYNLVQVTYADGSREQFTCDAKGNVLTRMDTTDQRWSRVCNQRGQPLTITNPNGGVVTYTYNSDATLAASTDSDTGLARYAYDSLKRLQQITHPDGQTVRFAYSPDDRLLSYTNEQGKTTEFAYDKNGNLTSSIDPLKQTTAYAYDLMDRAIRRTDPNGGATQYAYDVLGRVQTSTNRNGGTTTYSYNSRNWLTGVTDPAGHTWTTAYDDEGVPTTATTPTGLSVTFQTDKLGRTTSITDPSGTKTRFAYDKQGHLISARDRMDRTTEYGYDPRGRLSGVVVPVLGAVEYSRDASGLLTRIQDPRGAFWDFTYTRMGRLASQVDPIGRKRTYARDTQGRITQVAYPNGDAVAFTYDEVSRPIRSTYSDGLVLSYTYNDAGDLVSTNDLTFTYDARGDVTASRYDDGAVFRATYDPGRRLQSVTYDHQMTVTYTYDKRSLLTRVQDDLSGSWMTFAYDTDGRLVETSRSNGVSTFYGYDAAGRLVRIQDTAIADQQYELNAEGEPTRAIMSVPYGPGTIQYTYDAAGHLIAADYGNGNRLDYTYDAGGNLLKRAGKTPKDSTSKTSTFTFDSASQVSSPGHASDARGRQITMPGNVLTYDGVSQLRSITVAAGTVSLTYNGLGGLRTRTQSGVTTHCYQNYAMGLAPLVAKKQGLAYKRFYVYDPDGALLYGVDAATHKPFFYHFDRVGSTLFLTDGGDVTDGYVYDPYGALLGHMGDSDQPFTFIGRYGVRWEPAAGLYDMRARCYDPTTARFLTRDPIWPVLDLPQSLNLYQYAAQNPVQYIDPTGQQTLSGDEQEPWVLWAKVLTNSQASKQTKEAMSQTILRLHAINSLLSENPEGLSKLILLQKKLATLGNLESLYKTAILETFNSSVQSGQPEPAPDVFEALDTEDILRSWMNPLPDTPLAQPGAPRLALPEQPDLLEPRDTPDTLEFLMKNQPRESVDKFLDRILPY